MIGFVPEDLLFELDTLTRRGGHTARFDHPVEAVLVDAVAEAIELAGGRLENEPAAVFYAFGRRSRAFRPVARPFVGALVHAQAVASGYELDMNEAEFGILCARIVLGKIDPLELRGWIAARLRPFGQKPRRAPRRRPR